MATERPVHSEHPAMTFEGMRISWSGIWAGMLVVLGAMFVFSTLGVAVGFSVDAARNVAPDQITGGAVIWSRCSLLVALFLGGMAAARMSMVWDRFTGIAQGALLWVISMLALLLLGKSGVGLIGMAIAYGTAQPAGTDPSVSAWFTFFSIILSLLAAVAGSTVGQLRAAARARSV